MRIREKILIILLPFILGYLGSWVSFCTRDHWSALPTAMTFLILVAATLIIGVLSLIDGKNLYKNFSGEEGCE